MVRWSASEAGDEEEESPEEPVDRDPPSKIRGWGLYRGHIGVT